MSDETRGADFLVGLIIGGLMGAVAGLLLAPAPGEQARTDLREKSIELKERVVELSEEARKKAEELQAEGRSLVKEQKARVQGAVQEGKKAAAAKKQELIEELEKDTAASA